MNNFIISGNLGKDPKLEFTKNNTAVCSFSLAVRQSEKKDGEYVDAPAMWIQVKFFSARAEKLIDQIAKGDAVVVSGRLSERHYTTDEGVEKTSLELIGSDIQKVEYFKKAESSAPEQASDAPF